MKLRVALLLVSILMAGKSYADPMFGLTGLNNFRNDSYAFGEIFTVGSSDLLVTHLGAYDADDNGFNGPFIAVALFRESDDFELTRTFVTNADELSDRFRYHPIEPLVLFSGIDYRVVAVNGVVRGGDLYNIAPGFTVNPLITRTGYAYCKSSTVQSCDPNAEEFHSGTDTIWMANFRAEPTGPVGPEPVPEPASLILLGTGVAAIYARAWRAQRKP